MASQEGAHRIKTVGKLIILISCTIAVIAWLLLILNTRSVELLWLVSYSSRQLHSADSYTLSAGFSRAIVDLRAGRASGESSANRSRHLVLDYSWIVRIRPGMASSHKSQSFVKSHCWLVDRGHHQLQRLRSSEASPGRDLIHQQTPDTLPTVSGSRPHRDQLRSR